MIRPGDVDGLRRALAERRRRVVAPTKRNAAVLVPLYPSHDGIEVLFTLRTDQVPTHKNQVAFPGGGVDEDDRDITDTALRETEEELGIPRGAVTVLGLSDDTISITGQRVTPVVGYIHELPVLRPDPGEIADVFTVSLATLMRPEGFTEHEMEGPQRQVRRVPFFDGGAHTIWGLTAWILKELLTVMDGVDRGDSYLGPG